MEKSLELSDDILCHEGETSKRQRMLIHDLAMMAFSHHVVDQKEEHLWLCRRPATNIYHFYIAFLPGALAIYGDIGDAIFTGGDRSLAWLRGAVSGEEPYFSYLLGKSTLAKKEFFPGDAIELIREDAIESVPRAQKLADSWSELLCDLDDPGYSWGRACHECREAECAAECYDYDSNAYWCANALRWFVGNMK